MKRIVVALDNSPRAHQVLAAAARLAELTGAKLLLYRAINAFPDAVRDSISRLDGQTEDLLRRFAHEQLQTLAKEIAPELVEQISTSLAVPWDGICQFAIERDTDLIVIGSHGYGGLDRVLGTTAAKVVNHADRNVLVVRTPL